jgi:hypothetical protein
VGGRAWRVGMVLEERRAWMVPRGACSRIIGGPGERQLEIVLVGVCLREVGVQYRRSLGCVSESKKAYAAAACFKTEGISP